MRSLRRSPWYSATVIAVLGLTGALSTAAFAIVDGVLFKPLPYPNAHELFSAAGPGGYALSRADLEAWRQAAPDVRMAMKQNVYVVGAMAASTGSGQGDSSPRPARAAGVDAEFFDVLGQHPIVGSWREEDFQPGAARRRVMITNGLWKRQFGGRRDIVGQPFEIAGAADHMQRPLGGFEVAGVLPADFVYPDGDATPDLLLPLAVPASEATSRNETAGAALIRTAALVGPIEDRLLAAYGAVQPNPGDRPARKVTLYSVQSLLLSLQRDSLQSSFAASAVLMLLAVLNVAGLSVLRGRQQSHELGLRQALGATRVDLFRLALFDAVPLVAAGMIAALVASPWVIAAALPRIPSYIVFLKTPELDWRVYAFWIGLSVVTLLVSGALRAAFASPTAVTVATRRGETSTPRRGWFGSAAIAVQVALAFAMTLSGTLIVGTLWNLWQEPIGFSLDRMALVEVSHQNVPVAERRTRVLDLADQVRAVQGVEKVVPLTGGTFLARGAQAVTFQLPPGAKQLPEPGVWPVPAEYFDILNIHPVKGRTFTSDEVAANAPVAVLSESVAQRYFPAGDALGAELKTRTASFAIVGIVRDVQVSGLADTNRGQIYWPGLLNQQRAVLLVKLAKGGAPLDEIVAAVTGTKNFGVMRALTFTEAMGSAKQLTIFRAWLFSSFSLAALTIVAAGTFGIVAMSVGRRTRELGIRSALGATRESLIAMFVREQLLTVTVGLAIGGAISWWAGRLIKSYLFKVTPTDPASWLMAAVALIVVAVAAALVPALRASRIDPVQALKVD